MRVHDITGVIYAYIWIQRILVFDKVEDFNEWQINRGCWTDLSLISTGNKPQVESTMRYVVQQARPTIKVRKIKEADQPIRSATPGGRRSGQPYRRRCTLM